MNLSKRTARSHSEGYCRLNTQLASLVEMHSEAAHELLDRVEVETVHYVNVADDGKIMEKDREIAALKEKMSKLQDELKDALTDKEKLRHEGREVLFSTSFSLHLHLCLLMECLNPFRFHNDARMLAHFRGLS